MAAADSKVNTAAAGDDEVVLEMAPFGRMYKSGRVDSSTAPTAKVISVPLDVAYEDMVVDSNVRVRLMMPKSHPWRNHKIPILLNFHGGAFIIPYDVLGRFQRTFLTDLVKRANILLVNVDYRYVGRKEPPTPDGRLPAAYEDSVVALKWLFSAHAHRWLHEHGDFEHVFIAGDSAGANIASQLTMQVGSGEVKLPEGAKIDGVALLCPYFWGAKPIFDEYGWPNQDSPSDWSIRGGLDELWWRVVNRDIISSLDDPRINPVGESAPSVAGLGCGRAFLCIADDPWQWRSKLYFQRLMESKWGWAVQMYLAPFEAHVFFQDNLDSYNVRVFIASLAAFFECGR